MKNHRNGLLSHAKQKKGILVPLEQKNGRIVLSSPNLTILKSIAKVKK